MEPLFNTSLAFRQFLISQVEKMDDDLLDTIPEGFNNNIRWNLAHILVTQPLLTYQLAGIEIPHLSIEFIESAKKGSNPEDFSLNEDFSTKHLCELMIEMIKQTQRDVEELSKAEFKPYETSIGFVIKDLESAMAFSNIHDGIHIGRLQTMRKQLVEMNV